MSDAAPPSPRRGPGRQRIMVVDDDRSIRELMRLLLEEEGYEVLTAENGLRLIRALQVDRPDLILLDVMMSWIDGFELCRSLKQNPVLRPIPVAFVSARARPEDVRQGLASGAVAYFTKPIDIDQLLRGIRAALEGGRPPPEPAPGPEAAPPAP